jgi:hypothetical protein
MWAVFDLGRLGLSLDGVGLFSLSDCVSGEVCCCFGLVVQKQVTLKWVYIRVT